MDMVTAHRVGRHRTLLEGGSFRASKRPRCVGFLVLCTVFSTAHLASVSAWGQQRLFNVSGSSDLHPTAFVQEENSGDRGSAEIGTEVDDILSLADEPLESLSTRAVLVPAMSEEVSSVSRTAQPISRTAAAVYVLTNEMIRRSGARSVPEALRMAPGVDVARVSSSRWAISIRGFRGVFSDKLLIQIDGVAIYSPIHSGTFWERDLLMLEDVDRIEIIRGPGATVWGANAVNGIINVVTKSATETHGIYAEVGGGTEHRQFSGARLGGREGNVHYRIWGLHVDDGPGAGISPGGLAAPYEAANGGFRLDWTPTECDTLTLQGSLNSGLCSRQVSGGPGPGPPGPPSLEPMDFQATTFLTRWRREIDEETDWAVQLYYYDNYGVASLVESTSTFDLDFQYHKVLGDHELVCGFGYRNNDELLKLAGPPNRDSEQIPSYFLQDTMTLIGDRLFATVGIKLDHNSVTDFEYQPSVRVAWTPDERTSLWGAVSRAVRTPSLFNRSRMGAMPGSEKMISYEAGMRRQPTEQFFWEFSVFFARYNDLIVESTGDKNLGDADTYGFEWDAKYDVTPHWHLTGSYSFLIEDIEAVPGHNYPMIEPGGSPRNKFFVQSGWDLCRDVSLDVMVRYVDSMTIGVDAYLEGDIRLAWSPTRHLELAVVGRNLFDDKHVEFDTRGFYSSEVQREVYGSIAWRY
jgi:iron complex outermembrane recepter protein